LLFLVATTPARAHWSQRCLAEMRQTARVADLNPGTADTAKISFGFSRRDEFMAAYQGALYFQGNEGHTGSELWRVSKGSAPSQVVNLAPGSQNSTPHAFVVFQNSLYFAASTPATGEELYRYDGQSVTLAGETVPGATGAEILSTVVYGDAIYFTRQATSGFDVWRFDGATAEPVTAINSISGPVLDSVRSASPFAVFDGKLYFVDGPPSYRLFAFDGSTVSFIKALAVGNLATAYDMNLTVFQDELYFSVVALKETPFAQDELWRYDGKKPPAPVFVFPGNANSFSQPNDYAEYKGRLYFRSDGWWRYDGVAVKQVTGQLPSSIGQTSRFNSADRLFFSGFFGNFEDKEPYLFDGTTATLIKNIMPQDASAGPGSLPSRAVEVNGELYFYAVDDTHGRELWRTSVATRVIQHMKCEIVLAPIQEEVERWPPPLRELVVATWMVGERDRRLISREVVTVAPDRQIRVRGLEVKEGFVLATVAFDRKTGRIVDSGFDVVGRLDARVRRSLERTAAGLVKRSTLREVMSESIERQ